jgi:hypothetical protein
MTQLFAWVFIYMHLLVEMAVRNFGVGHKLMSVVSE